MKQNRFSISKVKEFYDSFYGEIIISGTSLLISICATIVLTFLFQAKVQFISVLIFLFGITMVSLTMALLFNQKRLFQSKLANINHILADQFGFAWWENQYYTRQRHFTVEKQILAHTFVTEALPSLFAKIRKDNGNMKTVILILDSGSTITPIFRHLPFFSDAKKNNTNLEIFTNNLAGIDEIHKLDLHHSTYSQEDFNLIGGQPLNKYRATTGEVTQELLESIWNRKNSSNSEIVTVGVLTANWFLASSGLNKISLCARGRGHFDFKKSVVENSDYVFLIAPLGKILRLDTQDQLNDLVPDTNKNGEYRSIQIPESNKGKCTLFTSFRDLGSISPLTSLSIALKSIKDSNTMVNFVFSDIVKTYNPVGSKGEVYAKELPHDYMRKNFQTAYGYILPQ